MTGFKLTRMDIDKEVCESGIMLMTLDTVCVYH